LGFTNFLNAGTNALYSDFISRATPPVPPGDEQPTERDSFGPGDVVNPSRHTHVNPATDDTYPLQDPNNVDNQWDMQDMIQNFENKMVGFVRKMKKALFIHSSLSMIKAIGAPNSRQHGPNPKHRGKQHVEISVVVMIFQPRCCCSQMYLRRQFPSEAAWLPPLLSPKYLETSWCHQPNNFSSMSSTILCNTCPIHLNSSPKQEKPISVSTSIFYYRKYFILKYMIVSSAVVGRDSQSPSQIPPYHRQHGGFMTNPNLQPHVMQQQHQQMSQQMFQATLQHQQQHMYCYVSPYCTCLTFFCVHLGTKQPCVLECFVFRLLFP
jgi:hypothetical protein